MVEDYVQEEPLLANEELAQHWLRGTGSGRELELALSVIDLETCFH